MNRKERLTFFDILRIVAISLILISHIALISEYAGSFSIVKWNLGITHYFYFDAGVIGFLLFLFISGAVLELNKHRINSVYSYVRFEIHRLLRLYPAYWMSLIFAMFLFALFGNSDMGDLFWQFSGFSAFVFQWGGVLNPVGWCIGLFVVMYMLYPFLSLAFNRKPWLSLVFLLAVSVASTYIVSTAYPGIPGITRWFPLCNLIYFGSGIFIIRQSWYPKNQDKTGITSYLGELSFYIFLFHLPILFLVKSAGIFVFLVCTLLISMVAMQLDLKIHECLKKVNLQ